MNICNWSSKKLKRALAIKERIACSNEELWLRSRLTRVLPAIWLLTMAPTLHAAVFDIACGDVAALTAAITSANAKNQSDVINLAPCAYTLTVVDNDTDGPNGLPSITSRIRITGAGPAQTSIARASAAEPFRLVHIARSGNLVLHGVRLTNGLLSSGTGGGLFNAGSATLTNSTVNGNAVVDLDDCSFCGNGPGGGIGNSGRLNMLQTTVADNFAGFGGGIFNSGVLKMTASTIADNRTDDSSGAGTCAGIDNRATATITSSTVSQNLSSVLGGGICNGGKLALHHSTVVVNFVFDGSGGGIINLQSGKTSIRNSIIAGNESCSEGAPPGFCPVKDDCLEDKPVTSKGFNLIGAGCSGGRLDIPVPPGQAFGTMLGPLQDNGGPTLTHVPSPGSLAIDAGASRCDRFDQRGARRPHDGDSDGKARCDIGAVEAGASL